MKPQIKAIKHLQDSLTEIDKEIYYTLNEEKEFILMNAKKELIKALDILLTF